MSNFPHGQKEKIRQLQLLTELNEKECQHLLSAAQWDLNTALNAFFDKKSAQTVKTDLFEKYKDEENPNVISIEGTLRLSADLDIEPTQLEFLLLSYQLHSQQMGVFHREDFLRGCQEAGISTLDDLKTAVHTTFPHQLDDQEQFRKVYNYAFMIGRQNGQKSLSLEAAIELWRLLLKDKFTLLEDWIQFLETKHGKAISRDTWSLFLEFTRQNDIDIQTYDSEGAWPILIDDFVDYMKK